MERGGEEGDREGVIAGGEEGEGEEESAIGEEGKERRDGGRERSVIPKSVNLRVSMVLSGLRFTKILLQLISRCTYCIL